MLCRSIRTRAGSLRMKTTSTPFQLSRENGDVKTSALSGAAAAATDVHKMDEFDIKILQQKRHEAEVKRSVSVAQLCGRRSGYTCRQCPSSCFN